MLKKRIIPILLYDEGRLQKTVQFSRPRDVGDPVKSAQVYSDQDADELVILNVSVKGSVTKDFLDVIKLISRSCFVPLTVGGGIRCIADVEHLFWAGADKVTFNSAAYTNLDLIRQASETYGKQAVVICIDYRTTPGGEVELVSHGASEIQKTSMWEHIEGVTASGAGELIIQSVERDGMMAGYDLCTINSIVQNTKVPVIVAGGAGDFLDLKAAFNAGVDGAACGSLFNFGDNNPLRAKAFLKNHQIPLKKI